MVKSMTGFGRKILIDDEAKISVEIRSVNHRYLDTNLKLSHRLLPFESKIRNILSDYMSRGKVDVNINYTPISTSGDSVIYNQNLAALYMDSIKAISSDFGLNNDLTATRLATLRDVLVLEETALDESQVWGKLEGVLKEALDGFLNQRIEEGSRLSKDVNEKLDLLEGLVSQIDNSIESVMAEYKERLKTRLNDLLGDNNIDENRLAQEFVIYADKVAIDEELVRLHSHISGFKGELKKGGEIGRKLDFISQELNREANTILSKTGDVGLVNIGIEIKTLIEKIREQIQNIE